MRSVKPRTSAAASTKTLAARIAAETLRAGRVSGVVGETPPRQFLLAEAPATGFYDYHDQSEYWPNPRPCSRAEGIGRPPGHRAELCPRPALAGKITRLTRTDDITGSQAGSRTAQRHAQLRATQGAYELPKAPWNRPIQPIIIRVSGVRVPPPASDAEPNPPHSGRLLGQGGNRSGNAPARHGRRKGRAATQFTALATTLSMPRTTSPVAYRRLPNAVQLRPRVSLAWNHRDLPSSD